MNRKLKPDLARGLSRVVVSAFGHEVSINLTMGTFICAMCLYVDMNVAYVKFLYVEVGRFSNTCVVYEML